MEDDEDSEHDDEVLGLGEEATGEASEKVSLTESTSHLFFFKLSLTEMCTAQTIAT